MANILEIIVKLNDQASAPAKSISKTLGGIGATATKAGGFLTAGLTLPLVGLGIKATMAASDLDESMSKAKQVFKDAQGPVLDFAETSASSYGIAQGAALDYAGTFGNLMTTFGLTRKEASKYSISLLGLAADQASFNNTSPEQALTAVQSALTGEFEPMKRYGVALNIAAIKQKAVEMGLIGVKDELTSAARVQATYSLLMEQSSNVLGDYSRTSDGLANSMRSIKAQFTDVLATIGTAFLPIAQEGAAVVKQLLLQFQGLSPELQRTIIVVAGIVAAIGPLLVIIGTLISAISTIIPVVSGVLALLSGPVILVLALVVGAIALLAYAWNKNWGDIQGKTKAAVTFIKDFINKALKNILAWWNTHKDQILTTVKNLWDTAKSLFKAGADFVLSLIGQLIKAVTAWWNKYGDDVIRLTKNVWNVLKGIFNTGKTLILGIVNLLLTGVRNFWDAHGKRITALVKALWDAIKTIVSGVSNIIGGIIRAFNAAIEGDWRAFGTALRSIWEAAWNTIKTVVTGLGGTIVGIIKGYVADIVSAFKSTNWNAVGQSMINGVIAGAKSLGGKLKQILRDLVKNALKAAKAALGIESPSKEFMLVGKNVVEGFIKGVQDTSTNVRGPMGDLRPTMTTNFYLTANYPYQAPRTLRSDVKRLNALYAGGRA